jgi:predicted MFS family arabinose efflux permease
VIPRPLVALFAATCGLAVASVYYAQPLLDTIADSFGIGHGSAGIVVTVTQVGYGAGLILLVPLGDILDRRRLIITLLLLAAAALIVVGAASSSVMLLAGVAALGLFAVVAQVAVVYAASLAPPEQRGQVVGAVTSGVVIGIVLARTMAGLITELESWRSVYFASAALTLALAGILLRALPRDDHRLPSLQYGELLRSVAALYAREPVLRVRGTLALLSFASLGVLWSSLVLPLSAPPLDLSHGLIGLFGLAGIAGAVAAVHAGRLADRGLGQITTGVALTLMLASWLPLGLTQRSLVALVVGLLLLELAVQAVHVSNQSMLYAVSPDARSRLAGTYMVFYSVGTGSGSIASTATYAWAGWTGVCVLGAAISALALTFWAATMPRDDPARSRGRGSRNRLGPTNGRRVRTRASGSGIWPG